jgi:hypothetical protein
MSQDLVLLLVGMATSTNNANKRHLVYALHPSMPQTQALV